MFTVPVGFWTTATPAGETPYEDNMINVYVDAVAGNDSTGVLNDASHPFQTINAGATAVGPSPASTDVGIIFWLKGTHVSPAGGFVLPWTAAFWNHTHFVSWEDNNRATIQFSAPTWFSAAKARHFVFARINVNLTYASISFVVPTSLDEALFFDVTINNTNGNGVYLPQHAKFYGCRIAENNTQTLFVGANSVTEISHSTLGRYFGYYQPKLTLVRCTGYLRNITPTWRTLIEQCSLILDSANLQAGDFSYDSLILRNSVIAGEGTRLLFKAAGPGRILHNCTDSYLYQVTDNSLVIFSGSAPTILTTHPFPNRASYDFTPSAELAALTTSATARRLELCTA